MGNHYICEGGCKGVSKVPGRCQAPDCAHFDQPLENCDCKDGTHKKKK